MSVNLFKFLPLPRFLSKINNLNSFSDLNAVPYQHHFHFGFSSKRASQSGRTMLEMLGVLAIVGILSLAGLAAYAIAMTYYRANQTIHDVMLRGSNVPMMYETYNTPNRPDEYNFVDLGNRNSINYAVETKSEPDGCALKRMC